jgi:peptide/nickel transport system substrate-binding protein
MVKKVLLAALLLTALVTGIAGAQEKLEPVPEIDFLTWVPAKFMAYFETSNYIAEEWRKLGLKVNLNQANMPNPLLTLWFKEHKFDCVVSVLSGLPYRMEPDFFTYSQFNSKNTAPGDWNVGEWSNAEFDEIGAKQLSIYDSEKRKPLINKLQEIIDREQPESVVYYEHGHQHPALRSGLRARAGWPALHLELGADHAQGRHQGSQDRTDLRPANLESYRRHAVG